MSPASTVPGLPIYSQEWLDTVATQVPLPLRPVVLAICRQYQLGSSSDPNTLARIITESLSSQLDGGVSHRLERIAPPEGEHAGYFHVEPQAVVYNRQDGWIYETDEWPFTYGPEEVVP